MELYMSEQSPQANSQEVQQTPQQHEASMQDRILNLLDPEGQPEEKSEPQSEAKPEDSQEQPEVKAEEKEPEIPQLEEIEIEGEKLHVPSALAQKVKDGFLRQQDYTKKTQEAAEVRKNYEAALQQASQVLELQKTMTPKLGQLASLDEQIAQYEKVDWNTLTAQDQTRALQLSIAFQQAKDARQKVVGELNQMQSQQADAAKQAHRTKIEEGQKALARDIKGWNEELGRKILTSTSEAYGAPAEMLANISEPWAVRALHDAMQYREIQAQAKKIPEKKAPVQTPTLKPTGSESRTPDHQSYLDDRKNLRSAKTNSERSKAAEKLILRKL
jgi:hypothetical protein